MRSIEFFRLYLDAAFKVTMILLLLSGVHWLIPKASAATRHLLWTVTICGCVGLPLFSVLLPAWRFPFIASSFIQPLPERNATNSPIIAAKFDPQWDVATIEVPLPVKNKAPEGYNWGLWLTVVWALGAWVVIAQSFIGFIVVALMKSKAQPLQDEAWRVLLREATIALRLRNHVRLYLSEQISVPITTGIYRASVLLPPEALRWPESQFKTVLLHELAHIKRRDCLTQMMANLACALYWWNPLVWIAARKMRTLREQACDDEVLSAGTRASDYASILINVAQATQNAKYTNPVTVGMACSQLSDRVTAILNPNVNRRKLSRSFTMTSIFLIAALILPLAALQPESRAANISENVIAIDQDKDEKKQQKEIEKHLREIEKHRRAIEKLRGDSFNEEQKAKLEAEIAASQARKQSTETQLRELVAKEVALQRQAIADEVRQRGALTTEQQVLEQMERSLREIQTYNLTKKEEAELLEKRAELSAQLERLQRNYKDAHPDVIEQKERLEALNKHLAELERERSVNQSIPGRAQMKIRLAELEAQLKMMRRSYTDKHPEVQSLLDQIEALKREIELLRK